jgi:hypothetical protein
MRLIEPSDFDWYQMVKGDGPAFYEAQPVPHGEIH